VLLRLLARGSLSVSDANLQHRAKTFEIEEILPWREGTPVGIQIDREYVRVDQRELVDRKELETAADLVFDRLKNAHKGSRIVIPEVEQTLARLRISKLTAGSASKSDLVLQVQDPYLRLSQTLGFSVKSMLGSPSSLLNASKATNFEYELVGATSSIRRLREFDGAPTQFVSQARSSGVGFRFLRLANETFEDNLRLVDSKMPELLAELLLAHYDGAGASLTDLVAFLATANPLGLTKKLASHFYSHKIRTLLADCALSMRPSKPWNGSHSTNGGYIIVDDQGEIHCLHAFERDVFTDYLLRSTYLEHADTKRHNYSRLIENPKNSGGPDFSVCLNLQIRFLR